jgi:hypothetical protein
MQLYWDDLSRGLQAFVNESNGFIQISIGSQFYPATPVGFLNQVTYVLAMCAPQTYAAPDVTVAPISDTQLGLIDSVSTHGPVALSGVVPATVAMESPTDMAISGGIAALAAVPNGWAYKHKEESPHAALVLVTAGIPGPDVSPTCHPSAVNAVAFAENGLSGTPSVRTFVLAVVGMKDDDLDSIALAGGTEHAHYAVTAEFIAQKLREIRREALPCDIALEPGEVTDPELALDYVALSGATEHYARVASAAACDATATVGQWFQGPGEGAPARLCPVTCEATRVHAGGRIDVRRSCRPPSVP